jgi:hypothetical protein
VTSASRPTPRWLAFAACFVAIVGVSAVWAGVSLILAGICAWIAVLAALDAALLLRLASWPSGSGRAALALAVTLATVLVANYFVASAQIGRVMGLRPVEAVTRMSLDLAALYAQSNFGPIEAAWYAAAAVVAWLSAR